MNRTTAAALISLAAVGAIGGGVSAVVRGEAPAGPPAAADPFGEPTADVLYAGGGVIHDGDREIRYAARFDTPDRLVRAAEGYLVAVDTVSERPTSVLYTVAADGSTAHLADAVGTWDLDPAGERVVSVARRSGEVLVHDLSGAVEARWTPPAEAASPVFTGAGTVLVAVGSGADQPPALWQWHPGTGAATELDRSALAETTASVDGSLLSGAVGVSGFQVPQENICLAVTSAPGAGQVSWDTCDYRSNNRTLNPFSPDGRRLLAVIAESDGFGPTSLTTFSATRGPAELLRSFDTPALTMDAVWLDDDHLLLQGATDENLDESTGSWIKACDLAGECTDVATRASGELVLGEQG